MPRDYYKEDRRDISYPRDRTQKLGRREPRTEGRNSLSSNSGYDQRNDSRYVNDHHDAYSRDKQHNSSYSRPVHDRSQREPSAEYDSQSRNDRKKKRKPKKRKHSKERTPVSSEQAGKSLVSAYDNVSPDSEMSLSPPRQSSRRGHDKPRNKSPSPAIHRYRDSASPQYLDRSPEVKKNSSNRGKTSRPNENRRQYSSPTHQPSYKKQRVHSPSPVPRRSR